MPTEHLAGVEGRLPEQRHLLITDQRSDRDTRQPIAG